MRSLRVTLPRLLLANVVLAFASLLSADDAIPEPVTRSLHESSQADPVLESEASSSEVLSINYAVGDPGEALPPAPAEDRLVADLMKRLSSVEEQLKKRDAADKKTADAAAKKFTVDRKSTRLNSSH